MAIRLTRSTAYERAAQRINPKQLVDNIKGDAQVITRDIPKLAQAELKPAAKAAGIGGGMFGAAGYLAANAASLLFLAGAGAFGAWFVHLFNWGWLAAAALGAVVMAIILLLIAGILALLGKSQIKKVQPPKQTIAETKATVDSIKASLTRGVQEVNTDARDRSGLAEVKKQASDLEKH